jgi:hypothetical protein
VAKQFHLIMNCKLDMIIIAGRIFFVMEERKLRKGGN